MMNLSHTIFPVIEVPAVGIPTTDNKEIDNTGYKFIVREDTNDILSCVTEEYRLVPNKSIIESATPTLKEVGAILTEAQSFGNGSRTSWTWKIPNIKVKIGPKDYVNPTITLRNSYDGTVQLHILAGAFRLVCSNGLVIGVTISKKVNKHSIYNVDLDKIEDTIKDTVYTVKDVFDRDFPVLTETKVNPKHVAGLIKMFPDFTIESMAQYLMAHKPKTYWDLLNTATYIATHHMRRNYETTHKLESSIYPTVSKWAKSQAQA